MATVVKTYPFVPGVDLAGVVFSSEDPRFQEGSRLLLLAMKSVFPISEGIVIMLAFQLSGLSHFRKVLR